MKDENAITSLAQKIKNTLVHLIGEDESEVIKELVQTYKNDTQELMQSLREAVANRDLNTITWATHTIKSSSSNLGANQLAELAYTLEEFGKAGDISMLSTQLIQLEAEYEFVCLALQRFND